MSRYEYANRRIETLESRLLSAAEFDELRRLYSTEALIHRLMTTEYARDLARALQATAGMTAIADACRNNVVAAYRNVSTFYDADGQRLLEVIAVRADIHNLRRILRGQRQRAPFATIISEMIPAGFLDDRKLRQLASHADPRATVNTLSAMHAAYGRAGREAVATFETTHDWSVAEAVFESHLYAALLARTSRGSDNDRIAATFLAGEIDARNVIAMLELRDARRQLDATDLERRVVHGGTVDMRKLVAIAAAPDDRAARAILRTIDVTTGLEFVLAGSLEEAVKGQLLRWGAAFLRRDPETVAPAIGYVEAKRLEARTIVRIAQEYASDLAVSSL